MFQVEHGPRSDLTGAWTCISKPFSKFSVGGSLVIVGAIWRWRYKDSFKMVFGLDSGGYCKLSDGTVYHGVCGYVPHEYVGCLQSWRTVNRFCLPLKSPVECSISLIYETTFQITRWHIRILFHTYILFHIYIYPYIQITYIYIHTLGVGDRLHWFMGHCGQYHWVSWL